MELVLGRDARSYGDPSPRWPGWRAALHVVPEQAKAATMPGENRRWLRCDSHAHSRRSTVVKRSRGRRERFAMANWCRRATISRCRAARERTNNQTSGGTKRGQTRWVEPIPSGSQLQSSQGVPRFGRHNIRAVYAWRRPASRSAPRAPPPAHQPARRMPDGPDAAPPSSVPTSRTHTGRCRSWSLT